MVSDITRFNELLKGSEDGVPEAVDAAQTILRMLRIVWFDCEGWKDLVIRREDDGFLDSFVPHLRVYELCGQIQYDLLDSENPYHVTVGIIASRALDCEYSPPRSLLNSEAPTETEMELLRLNMVNRM